MVITGADADAPVDIGRLERAAFAAWPAAASERDGAWLIRITPDHPSKRLNSLNCLDPGDDRAVDGRLAAACERLRERSGRACVRVTPLTPPAVSDRLDDAGWRRFDETIVMTGALAALAGSAEGAVAAPVVLDDPGWFDAFVALRDEPQAHRAALRRVIAAIEPACGLFLITDGEEAAATAMAVAEEDLVGLFEVTTRPALRRRGYGKRIVAAALDWGRERGAGTAYLQVVADNRPAVALYHSLGFNEVYRYHYRSPAEAGEEARNGP